MPTKHSKLCSLHFTPDDFVLECQDSNSTRRKRKSETPLRRRLKDDAVPSVFPNCPAYLSSPAAASRTTSRATSSSRHQREADRMAALEQSFFSNDDIAGLSLSTILQRLKAEACLPDDYQLAAVEDSLVACLIAVKTCVPSITGSIVLHSDFSVTVSLNGQVVSASQYSNILKGTIDSLSQLLNIMARLKAWITEPSERPLALCIDMTVNLLKPAADTLEHDSDEYRKLSFITEQLQLLSTSKYGRSYSPQLTIMCYMISAASSAAYNVILEENILCLPSTSTLKMSE